VACAAGEEFGGQGRRAARVAPRGRGAPTPGGSAADRLGGPGGDGWAGAAASRPDWRGLFVQPATLLRWHAAWASGRSTICMLPVQVVRSRGQRRPPGDHRLRIAVHERPVGLGQVLQQRLGPRPATAVEEVFHGQACYLPGLLRRPQPAQILTTAAPGSSTWGCRSTTCRTSVRPLSTHRLAATAADPRSRAAWLCAEPSGRRRQHRVAPRSGSLINKLVG
jgi:hypothetical protein